MVEVADAGRNTYMRPLVVLAIETAMRQGETLSLTWSDFDLDKRIAHLDMTKNGESRDVPLSSRALDALDALKQQQVGERVVPSTKSGVQQAWAPQDARGTACMLHFDLPRCFPVRCDCMRRFISIERWDLAD